MRSIIQHPRSLTRNRKSTLVRFLQFVEKGKCWLWTGSIASGGYGKFYTAKGKYMRAHRMSFLLFKGRIGEGKVVRHSCDVRRCVKPQHLKRGTQRDNVLDAARKGKMCRPWQTHNTTKLLPKDVRQIRALWSKNPRPKQRDIAERFGVSQAAIWYILHRWNWRKI